MNPQYVWWEDMISFNELPLLASILNLSHIERLDMISLQSKNAKEYIDQNVLPKYHKVQQTSTLEPNLVQALKESLTSFTCTEL